MLFGNFFGNKSQLPGTGSGKFERHRNLLSDKGAFGPFGVSLPCVEKTSVPADLTFVISR